jgi:hypothetical protein
MQNTIDDIKGMLQNAEGDLSPADLVDLANEVIAMAIKVQVKAQMVIDAKVDLMTNAFDMGGSLNDEFEEILTSSKGF